MPASLKEMSSFTYIPENIEDFTRFLMHYAILPEMEPYQHDKTGLLSVASDVAERIYQPGVYADKQVAQYEEAYPFAA